MTEDQLLSHIAAGVRDLQHKVDGLVENKADKNDLVALEQRLRGVETVGSEHRARVRFTERLLASAATVIGTAALILSVILTVAHP
jgi:hypothetical protein